VEGRKRVKQTWSSVVRLGELGSGPVRRRLEPDEAQRKAIARELDLVQLPKLEADLAVEPWFDGGRITGRWSARVVQTCGVTLERLESDLAGVIDLKVVPEDSVHAPSVEAQLAYDPEADEPPDVLEGEAIDLAAYLVEHLALEIDPFPRKPDAEFAPPDMGPEPGPFDALKKLKGTEG
jgi:hypothetical protein